MISAGGGTKESSKPSIIMSFCNVYWVGPILTSRGACFAVNVRVYKACGPRVMGYGSKQYRKPWRQMICKGWRELREWWSDWMCGVNLKNETSKCGFWTVVLVWKLFQMLWGVVGWDGLGIQNVRVQMIWGRPVGYDDDGDDDYETSMDIGSVYRHYRKTLSLRHVGWFGRERGNLPIALALLTTPERR